MNNEDKTLEGAEFVVRKNTTDSAEYFKASAEGGQWVTSYEEATKYTTDSTGIVEVKGLEYGTYQLQETKLQRATLYRLVWRPTLNLK